MRKFTLLILLLISCDDDFVLDGTWTGADSSNNEWVFDMVRSRSTISGTFRVHWVDTDIEQELSGWYYGPTFKSSTAQIELHFDFEYENADFECEYHGLPIDGDTIDGYVVCTEDGRIVPRHDLELNISRS